MRYFIICTWIVFIFAGCGPSNYMNGNNGLYNDSGDRVGVPLYRGLTILTNKLVEGIESDQSNQDNQAKPRKKVAVIEFSHLNDSRSAFGRFLAEKLISTLFETRRFEVVERNILNKLLEEHKLSQAGITTPEVAEKLGELVGADAIISGTITDIGSGFDVNARIINTRTGGLIGAASVVIVKDETVKKLLQMELPPSQYPTNQPDDAIPPEPGYTTLPAGSFRSAIEVDTRVMIKLDPVYENAKKKHTLTPTGNRLIWKFGGERGLVAYIHASGKIIILSPNPLSSKADMDAFRDAYVLITNYVMNVNVDMNKTIRNESWEHNLIVYNYERNTYKRIMGYFNGSAYIRIPRMNIKQATLFVYANGFNNRIYIDGVRFARWEGKQSKVLDVTRELIYGDHRLEIKQYGGTKPFFVLEFFVESAPGNVTLTFDNQRSMTDNVSCYSINELRLPN